MSRYTLLISGRPMDDAREVLAATGGVSSGQPGAGALSVTVDAPNLEQAVALVEAALPSHGSYSVARPEPLEDDPED